MDESGAFRGEGRQLECNFSDQAHQLDAFNVLFGISYRPLQWYDYRMKATIDTIALGLFVILGSLALLFAPAAGQQPQPEFVKQGQQLMRDGKPEEALALYRMALQASPNSLAANIAAGSLLDLMGKGEEGRQYFAKAIDVADMPESKAAATRAMAMSYAFEGNYSKAIEYERQVAFPPRAFAVSSNHRYSSHSCPAG